MSRCLRQVNIFHLFLSNLRAILRQYSLHEVNKMNDSADIKSASIALTDSVDSLEEGIAQLLSRMQALEAGAKDSDAFREDRVKLAGQLDDMASQAEAARNKLAAREAEFAKLTQASEAELDRVMTIVRGELQPSIGA